MDPRTGRLMSRLASDPAFADRYFAEPGPVLDEFDIPETDRAALPALDREAVIYLAEAGRLEPQVAAEHPSNNASNRHMTVVIALWGCAAFVIAWLSMRSA